jgi:DnaJ-class molecular chaperone
MKLRKHLLCRSIPVLALFLFPAYLQPQTVSQEVCLACHGAPGLQKVREGKKVSLHVEGQQFSRSVHVSLGCALCHAGMAQIPHPAEAKPAPCATCHAKITQAYDLSVHGKARLKGLTEAASCARCHGRIHEIKPRTDRSSPVRRVNITGSCAACHAEPRPAEELRIPALGPVEGYLRSVHSEAVASGKRGAVCTDCHGSHAIVRSQDPGSSTSEANIQTTCGACHGEALKDFRQSVHGKANAKGDRDAATCGDCHGSHNVLSAKNPESPVYPLNLPRTCGACHGDPELAKRHRIPLANAYQLYMDSIHGRALTKSGLLVAANCVSCHGSHKIKPKEDPESRIYRTTIPSTCGHCHAGIQTEYFQGIHGQAVKRGSQVAPVCVDCHTAHEIRRVEVEAWKLDIIRECGTCHRESLRSYRDTFHGQVTSLGFTRVARCSDCHGTHRILPASDRASSISTANLVSTCRKCHPQASENFVRYSPHADPSDKHKNPGLYYAARFMNFLLIGVFLFFGIHTSLWMFRSTMVGWLRKPPDQSEETAESDKGNGDDERKP